MPDTSGGDLFDGLSDDDGEGARKQQRVSGAASMDISGGVAVPLPAPVLDANSAALLAAIQASMGVRFDGIDNSMKHLNKSIGALGTRVASVETKIEDQGGRLSSSGETISGLGDGSNRHRVCSPIGRLVGHHSEKPALESLLD